MSHSAHEEQSYKEADALRDPYFPSMGEIVIGANGTHGVAVGGIDQPAGRMVINGATLADTLGVREERACVWVALKPSLKACHRDIETARDAVAAVRADAIYPTPAATTMIAPTDVDDLAEVLADG